jgi:hypothetical protein
MEDGRPAAIYFWYRQSPARSPDACVEKTRGVPSDRERSAADDGMVGVELDTLGRLSFRGGPVPRCAASVVGRGHWSIPAQSARCRGSPAQPLWLPLVCGRPAWVEGNLNDRTGRCVEAAARGRLLESLTLEPSARTARPAELTQLGRDFDPVSRPRTSSARR